ETGPWLFAVALVALAAVGYAVVRGMHVTACDLVDEATASRVLGTPAKHQDPPNNAGVGPGSNESLCGFVTEGRELYVTLHEYPSAEEAGLRATTERDLFQPEPPFGVEVVRSEQEPGLGDKAFSVELRLRPVGLSGVIFAVVKGRRQMQVLISTKG